MHKSASLPLFLFCVKKHWRRDNLAPHNEAPWYFRMNTCVRGVVLINTAKVSHRQPVDSQKFSLFFFFHPFIDPLLNRYMLRMMEVCLVMVSLFFSFSTLCAFGVSTQFTVAKTGGVDARSSESSQFVSTCVSPASRSYAVLQC